MGGKLAHFSAIWERTFPENTELLRRISQGILISFRDEQPALLRHPVELRAFNPAQALTLAVNKLLDSQAIEVVQDPSSPGYYNRLFLVPKPDGTFRPIIDLKRLNRLLDIPTFKMETLFSIVAALQPQEWIVKIDLKDAYHHIPVHPHIRKYFRFVLNGVTYQFRALPFGLSTAPREFTKTLAPVVTLLRSWGIRVHAYLDDWILRADSRFKLDSHANKVLKLLQELGWTVNWKKSNLIPSQQVDFLGLHFDLNKYLVAPPETFRVAIQNMCCQLKSGQQLTARMISSINSKVTHFAPFIHQGRLHLRYLQFWLNRQWAQASQSWEHRITLDQDYLSRLQWFSRQEVTSGVPINFREATTFFFTDASLMGWGASWNDLHISGQWPENVRTRHINWLELVAVRLAIQHWGHLWQGQVVRVYSDNSTTVSYIRKQGGTRSWQLFLQTVELYQLLDQWHITLIPTHLPGARNVTADALSRLQRPSPTEWRLPQETLLRLFSVLGTPCLDMFATATNKVVDNFVSPYQDETAWAVDALSISWENLGLVYAFPPAPIIPRTLEKIQQSVGTKVILIASQSPARPWHPLLLELSIRPRIPLNNPKLFQFLPGSTQPTLHRDPSLFNLAAWILSGKS